MGPLPLPEALIEGRRRHRLPNDRQKIRVEEGKHTLLVRADQSRSRYDFSLNICEVETDPRYDGNRLPGVRFTVPAGQTPAAVEMEELSIALISWSYGTINGYHPRKEQYYVSHRRRLSATAMDEVGTGSRWGGGLSVLLLEERRPVDPRTAEERSLRFAVEEAHRQDESDSNLHHGFSGFECWINALETGAVENRYALTAIAAGTAEGRQVRKKAGKLLREAFLWEQKAIDEIETALAAMPSN